LSFRRRPESSVFEPAAPRQFRFVIPAKAGIQCLLVVSGALRMQAPRMNPQHRVSFDSSFRRRPESSVCL
jgi:hypothetical protein